MKTTLLTIAEAATLVKASPTLLRTHCQQGRIPCEKIGRAWVIERSALDTFMARDTKRGPKAKNG